MKNWSQGNPVEVRNPSATRPWQHVLEPLSGYLSLARALFESKELNGESFNFGPRADQNKSVLELISDLSRHLKLSSKQEIYKVTGDKPFHEAGLLKLNCEKSLFYLGWEPNLQYDECVQLVGSWYYNFYNNEVDMLEFTFTQIKKYEVCALKRGINWAS